MAKEISEAASKGEESKISYAWKHPFKALKSGCGACLRGIGKVAGTTAKVGLIVGVPVLVTKRVIENANDKEFDVHLINEEGSKGIHVSVDSNVVHTDRDLSSLNTPATEEPSEQTSEATAPEF